MYVRMYIASSVEGSHPVIPVLCSIIDEGREGVNELGACVETGILSDFSHALLRRRNPGKHYF